MCGCEISLQRTNILLIITNNRLPYLKLIRTEVLQILYFVKMYTFEIENSKQNFNILAISHFEFLLRARMF